MCKNVMVTILFPYKYIIFIPNKAIKIKFTFILGTCSILFKVTILLEVNFIRILFLLRIFVVLEFQI